MLLTYWSIYISLFVCVCTFVRDTERLREIERKRVKTRNNIYYPDISNDNVATRHKEKIIFFHNKYLVKVYLFPVKITPIQTYQTAVLSAVKTDDVEMTQEYVDYSSIANRA